MAKKKSKTAEELIYEIRDLLDDLQLKLDPDDNHVSYEDDLDDEDLDIDDEDEED
jgi:hypothetical protein